MASQMTVTGEELNARPVTRPGEILEAVPGLIVTQHSGEGKANQYFLRGYNLDHGTDMAISVDDMPINMRTHAHGQGYADLNWLMPETVNSLEVRKGPYFADEGDFGSAGNLHIGLIDSVNKTIAQMTVGSFGYERFFGMGSTKIGEGTLLFAGEVGAYNGPWVNPDDMRKISSHDALHAKGPRRTGFPSPAWRIRTSGIQPTRCRNGPSRRARSDFTARKTRPMAAIPTGFRSRREWPAPTTPDHGKPMPTSSKANSICSTISPIS